MTLNPLNTKDTPNKCPFYPIMRQSFTEKAIFDQTDRFPQD